MNARILTAVGASIACLGGVTDAQMEFFFDRPVYHIPPWGPIPQYEGSSYIAAHKMKHAIWIWEDPADEIPRFLEEFDEYGKTYDWGDGTVTTGFYDHIYLDDGPFTLRVSAWAKDTATGAEYSGEGAFVFDVRNVDPVIEEPIPNGFFLRPGKPVAVSLDFSDAGTLDTHEVEVESEKPLLSATVNPDAWTIELLFAPQEWTWGATPPSFPVTIRLFDDDGGMAERSLVLIGVIPEPQAAAIWGWLIVAVCLRLRRR